MMNPNELTSGQINELRQAAEAAWGDDTRHQHFIGHPQPSAGNCFVTASWLQSLLGGHVVTKKGHFFWLSPDKHHILDLSGDWFAYEPMDPSENGIPQDEDDEPWVADPHLQTHRPGPAMYKRADHPLWKGFRVIGPFPNNERARIFAQRADAHLRSGRTSSRQADLMGADPFPGEMPQRLEDMKALNFHDEPQFDISDLTTDLYQFIYGNGQLHLSPVHSHEELSGHAGLPPEYSGPIAVGYVSVSQGKATWEVETNIAVNGLAKLMKDYTKRVGWQWNGMTGTDGTPIDEALGPTTSMFYRPTFKSAGRPINDRLIMSPKPLPKGRRITIEGKTAYTPVEVGWIKDALSEWATDFGYKLADYPGGTDMHDRMKNKEDLDLYNRGDTDFQPERHNPDTITHEGPFTCNKCGYVADTFADYRLHTRDHEPMEDTIEDGHFPNLNDFDDPLPLRIRNVLPTSDVIATVLPLPSYRHARRVPEFDLYADLFHYAHDENMQFYGAFRNGEMLGYGAVRVPFGEEPEVLMIYSSVPRQGIGSALMQRIQLHYPRFYTHSDSPGGESLLRRHGCVNINRQLWRYAKGTEPKDMIEAPIPFIYDIQNNNVEIGYAGARTNSIQGQFPAGGIVEGFYEPGGKMTIQTATTLPWSVHNFVNLWYARYPQMEVTGVEKMGDDGKTQKLAQKLAAESVGQYIRTILPSDQAAFKAYKALSAAGGKVYVVGGAIRDALQQKVPNDIDLMVAGLPSQEVEHVLDKDQRGRCDLTGKSFGVYRYKYGGDEVEIALPRLDKYETSRRGEGQISVDHTLPVEEDLLRRDFTANSMAVDLDTGQLIDPHGGAKDIQNGVLRTTHPDSFQEDPTRLVRALVAHGRFGLNPDERTRQEMVQNAVRLRDESPDALNKVLDKLFKSNNPAGAIRLGQETGVLQHLFPEVANNFGFDQQNSHHYYPLGDHLLQVLHNISEQSTDPDLRMAALLHDIGKPASKWVDDKGEAHYYRGSEGQGEDHEIIGAKMAEDRLRQLNYPTARIRRVTGIINHHMFSPFNTAKGARRFLQNYEPYADDLINLRRADQEGKGQSPQELAARTSADSMANLVEQARSQQAPTSQAALSVNGDDLMAMGVPQGPEVGRILRRLVDDVVQDPMLNERGALLQRAHQYVLTLA